MTNKQYAITGLLAPFIFWTIYFIMSTIRPDYSLFTKAVSELGSLDAPHKWIWNILGYIIPGILISIFSFGLYKSVAGWGGNKLPLVGMVLSGLFMSLSGIFPGDFDNRQSLTMLFHTVGSVGSYIFFLLGAFSYLSQFRKNSYWKSATTPTLIFICLTLVFGAWPFIFPDIPALGQRIVFFFYFLWVFYTALRLYRQPKVKTLI